MGRVKQAYLIVNQSTREASRLLLARCCLQLGLLQEAEHALVLHAALNENGLPKNVPGGAEGYFLLGVISRREHRREAAIELFRKSLEVSSLTRMALNYVSARWIPFFGALWQL